MHPSKPNVENIKSQKEYYTGLQNPKHSAQETPGGTFVLIADMNKT